MTDRSLQTLYGPLQVPDWPDDLILRSLAQLGEWCLAETALAAALVAPGDRLWDGGAFLGTFALGTARHSAPAHVLAIEANPDLAGALGHNLGLLPCPADLVAAGLGPQPGWLSPLAGAADNHGATAYAHHAARPAGGPAIPCRTLPDLRQEFGDYDLLKLDLEGMELDVLRADFAHLAAHHPVIWLECNESPASLQLFSALTWLRYDMLYLAFPAFRRANFNASADLIYPMAYEAALVAAPAERLAALRAQADALVPGEDIICRPITTAFDLRRALFDTPRWARPEWTGMSRAELIARLGRQEQQKRLGAFLLDMPEGQAGSQSQDHPLKRG